ncbi:MAG: DUF1848 family protein, partial [Deltaproteobacteria bacterium]|nr:DUF1848 family protein [Deltaproteobacteria bacterium]
AQGEILARTARDHGIDLQFCSMEGFPISRCIDGGRLSEIHPERLPASTRKAGGQRPLCGCTRSLDIGWYSLACHHECLYCYARP